MTAGIAVRKEAASSEREPLAVAGKYLSKAPVDLERMAHDLGLSVDMEADLPQDVSGRICRGGTGSTGLRIELNRQHSFNRRRFTLAHELAHFLLHRTLIGDGVEDDQGYRSRLGDGIELEANRVATQVLIPGRLLRNLYDSGVEKVSVLSEIFEVSEAAMRTRLRQLGLDP